MVVEGVAYRVALRNSPAVPAEGAHTTMSSTVARQAIARSVDELRAAEAEMEYLIRNPYLKEHQWKRLESQRLAVRTILLAVESVAMRIVREDKGEDYTEETEAAS